MMGVWRKKIPAVLIIATACSAPVHVEPARSHVEVRVSEQPGSTWLVELVIPADNLGALDLRDMRHYHQQCPEIEYEIVSVDNATSESVASPRWRMRFRPLNSDPVRISYTVTPEPHDLDHSIPDLTGCSAIIDADDAVLLDGRALFLALRPTNSDDSPYRFGAAILRYSGEQRQNAHLSTGSKLGEGSWRVDRVDELQFAFIAAGSWEYVRSGGEPMIEIGWFGDALSDPSSALSTISRSSHALRERWGNVEAPSYSIFLTPPTSAPDSVGQFTGVAYPHSTALHHGAAMHERHLMIGIVHELAHKWVPARLGQPVNDLWIGEGMAELAAHIELVRLGYLTDDHLISRINRAIVNIDAAESPLQTVYDVGILSWLIASESSRLDLLGDRFDALFLALVNTADQPLSSTRFWALAGRPSPISADNVGLFDQLPCRLSVNGRDYVLQDGGWPDYQTGWRLSDSQAGLIESLVAGGAAEAAGLAEGDLIELVDSLGFGDIHSPLTVHFSRNGVRQTVTFNPVSGETHNRFPQYVPVLHAVEENRAERCNVTCAP